MLPDTQHLHSLKSLNIVFLGLRSHVVSTTILTFPKTLRMLALSGCGLLWKNIAPIGILPHLEILKLWWGVFRGSSWNICSNEFKNLSYLLLEDLDLKKWTYDSKFFPELQKLDIHHYYKLNMVPGEIGTCFLLDIEVDDCSITAINLVKKTLGKIDKDKLSVSITDSFDCNDKDISRW